MSQEFGINEGFVEELHLRWQENPGSVSERWRKVFEARDGAAPNGTGTVTRLAPPRSRPRWRRSRASRRACSG
jgi:2-oxoglutarate dehydrogenase complex dehydrogenase (E1) component-like enzyme